MKRGIFFLVLISLLLFCAGCGNNGEIEQDPNVLDSQEYLPETVHVGVVLPLSGEESVRVDLLVAAQEVALDIINNSHEVAWGIAQSRGISNYGQAQMELVYEDIDVNLSLRATADATMRLANLGVVSLLGAYHSEDSAQAAIRACNYNLPLVCGASRAADLTDGESYDFGGWFFRIAATMEMETDLYFSYLKYCNQTKDAGISTVALVYEDTQEGQEVATVFSSLAESYGFSVAAKIAYPPGQESMAVELQNLLTVSPQVVFHYGGEEELKQYVVGYQSANFVPEVAFCYGDTFQNSAFSLAVKKAGVEYWCGLSSAYDLGFAEEDAEKWDLFFYINSLYREKTGVNLDNTSLLEFAAVIVTAQSISLCGTTDAAALQAALMSTTFDAPYLTSGSIRFDENGQNTVVQGYVAQLAGGRYLKAYQK